MYNLIAAPFLPIGNILFSFTESTGAGKMIILILVVASVYAWTVMIAKSIEVSRAERATKRFVAAYRSEAHPLNLFLKSRDFSDTPLYAIYDRCCDMLGNELEPGGLDSSELFVRGMGERDYELKLLQLEALRNLNERNVADQAILLEDKMGILATAVSVCPFLGLLGTVWGVMDSFGGMAVTGAATLPSVAPGIAAALLTTIVGLIVALPSAVGYNYLTNRIRKIIVQMDNFAQELSADLQNHFYTE